MDAIKDSDLYVLIVSNAKGISEVLNIMGFSYDKDNKVWLKKLTYKDISLEIEKIKVVSSVVEMNYYPKAHMQAISILYIVASENSFMFKDQLSKLGYKFNGYGFTDKVWVKKTTSADLKQDENKLKKMIGLEYDIVDGKNDLKVNANKDVSYIVVSGKSFDYKDTLKERKYRFNGYDFSGNVWVKQLSNDDVETEKSFLKTLKGVKFEMKSKAN